MDLPLVLLHAFPLDSRMWDGVRERLDPITPDQRAQGEPDLAAAARRVLDHLDERGIERAVVGGCSMGGYVAMALLRQAPERLAGLVLADTRAGADTEEARANRLAVAERAEAEGVGEWLAGTVPALLAPTSPEEVSSRVRGWVLDQDPADVAWAQRAMAARPDSTELLRAARVPALVVVGEHDGLTPPRQARELADLLRGELVQLPGVGHLAPVEAPDAFADAVLDWRQRLAL
ncbi:alpha/beta fold hydrolase [Saccharothrix coeruleofusca]|nr:alpha/beta hydrolase [Saccharothrix coeruleofusca]